MSATEKHKQLPIGHKGDKVLPWQVSEVERSKRTDSEKMLGLIKFLKAFNLRPNYVDLRLVKPDRTGYLNSGFRLL